MRFGSINYEVKGRVAILTLDEPSKLNALSESILQGLDQGLNQAESDEQVRAIIIASSHEKVFCAGADISGFQFTTHAVSAFIDTALDILSKPERCAKPVIALVNGLALGGGLELSMACDFVLSSDKARFGVPEIQLGLLPGFGIVRLPERVGRQNAKALSMKGDPISAKEAEAMDLVLRVVPHDELMAEGLAFAEKIASKPRIAIKLAKQAYNRNLGGQDTTYAKGAMSFLFLSEDAVEGINAFREKRKPNFS